MEWRHITYCADKVCMLCLYVLLGLHSEALLQLIFYRGSMSMPMTLSLITDIGEFPSYTLPYPLLSVTVSQSHDDRPSLLALSAPLRTVLCRVSPISTTGQVCCFLWDVGVGRGALTIDRRAAAVVAEREDIPEATFDPLCWGGARHVYPARDNSLGAFHLVRTQFYMLSGPTHPHFACNTQWKCIGGLTPPTHPRCVRN